MGAVGWITVVALGSAPLAGVAAAAAAEPFVAGLYLQSEALCAQARTDGLQTVIEAGNVVLTARGLDALEYDCEFLTVTPASRAPGWVVTALCQEPGYAFPDVLSVIRMTDTQLELASVRTPQEGDPGNGGSYFLCEGVELP